MGVETGSLERITKTPEPDEGFPDWSPNGKRIAYELDEAGSGAFDEFDVYVMNVDGTKARRLSRRGDFDQHPVWSPDGTFIAYASDAGPAIGDETEIVIVDADTGRHVRHFPAPGLISYAIDWTAG